MSQDDKIQEMISDTGELESLLSDVKAEALADIFSSRQKQESKESYVRIADDGKEAWLYLVKKPDDSGYTKQELVDYIQSKGVKFGLMMSNISAMAKKRVYNREIKIAVFGPPEEGSNGYYEFFFDTQARKNPKIRSDGSVDYQSMSLLQNVTEGSILCKYHPAKPGKEGALVDGTALAPAPVKDLPQIKGKGFEISEDGCEYKCTITGKLDYTEGSIRVSKVYEIKGDVTLVTGNVKFDGDIVIYGNVDAEVCITAGRSLTVEGTVAGANLIAGKDVVLKRGIQGAGKGTVIAGGSVFADFIEHSQIEALENVESNTILSGKVSAGKKVILTGRKGLVIGGYIHGLSGIEAVNAGNDAEVRTILHAGMESADHEKNLELMKTDSLLRESAAELIDRMKKLLSVKKTRELTENEVKMVEELSKKKDELVRRVTENKSEMEKMNAIIERASRAEIRINGKVNRGVIIGLNNQRLLIENTTTYMSYKSMGGLIIGTVIVK